MTMKKRLFLSNAVIVCVSLIILMAVMLGMVKFAGETYLSRFDDFQKIELTDSEGITVTFDNVHNKSVKNEIKAEYKKEILSIIISVISVGTIAIALILFISNCFTRYMLNKIMRPVDVLNLAAKRISGGDFDTFIDYENDDEFKTVCQTFDEMQKNLKESREQNESYERARISMITDISHDMRTPLTSVKGFLKAIKDGVADTEEKRKMYVDIAYNKACIMEQLLNKLFYFSKLETKNMPVNSVKTDLKQYLSDYTNGIFAELNTKGANINFECQNGTYYSDIDKGQFGRVFDNLVENSIKYNENVSIKISLKQDEKNNIIEFSDNGTGVPDEVLDNLFERFYRVDKSRGKSGSGLGLYIVKSIVELNGGTVKAENDNGLKFIIKLPRSK